MENIYTIIDVLSTNMLYIVLAFACYIVAEFSNVCFSVYQNVKVLKLQFDKAKFIQNIIKIISVLLGVFSLALLCNGIGYVIELGFEITGAETLITSAMLIVTIGKATIRKAKEAYVTFNDIFGIITE